MTQFIGYLAAILTTISFLPQAIKVISSRNTSGISLLMYALYVSGVFCWLLYGILIGDKIICIANLITLGLSGIILFIKIRSK